jgi:hypothetical protein
MMQVLQNTAESIPETLTSAVTVMFNSPTEMLSYTGAILGAKHLGIERFPWLLSNDEQKNMQIMAKIFEKSKEQYDKKGTDEAKNVVEITDKELHEIYNQILNTMGMGKFFLRRGYWLWKKWDQFKQRKEYKQKELAGLSENNEKSM